MTAEEFVQQRYDLPEGGRWAELEDGSVVELTPPTIAHGNAVLNLSRALGQWIERTREGYACFELGLIVARDPDTVCCPPVSYFLQGSRWEELDREITTTRPALVVEIASTPDRFRALPGKVARYLTFGADMVWVLSPQERTVAVHLPGGVVQWSGPADVLEHHPDWVCRSAGRPLLSGFSIPVASIYREPDWWNPTR